MKNDSFCNDKNDDKNDDDDFVMSATNSTTGDGDAAAADRVEKKSIDEAIASFAMLVRSLVASLFLEEAESLKNDASSSSSSATNRF